MNNFEIIFLIAAWLTLMVYSWRWFPSRLIRILAGGILLISLYLSMESCSQFLTTDEPGMLKESMQLVNMPILRQWNAGAFRTSEAFLALPSLLLNMQIKSDVPLWSEIVWKLAHWMFGFVTLLWIHQIISRHFIREEHRPMFFILYVVVAFLLPTNIMGLKVFNYDLLSMTLAVVALSYLAVGLEEAKCKYYLMATAVAVLAAQEKLVASPVLILAVALCGYGFWKKWAQKPWLGMFAGIGAGLFLGVLVAYLSAGIVALVRQQGNVPADVWARALDPFVSWMWVVIFFVVGNHDCSPYTGLLRLLTCMGIVCISLICVCLDLVIRKRETFKHRLLALLPWFCSALTLLVLVVGLIGLFKVQVYWHPFHPILEGAYRPLGEFNHTVWHFGAMTKAGHVLSFIAYACATYVMAVPTVLWIVVIGTWLRWRSFKQASQHHWVLSIIYILGLLFPLVFGLGQIPVGHKYLNVGLFLFALIGIIRWQEVFPLSKMRGVLLCAIFCLLVVAEGWAFRPCYFAFRPFWVAYPDPNRPVVGKPNPSWVGWGEEVMLAGRKLEAAVCQTGETSAKEKKTLYYAYYGRWLHPEGCVRTLWIGPVPKDQLEYTQYSYFVINRSIVVQGYPFPYEVQPDFTIAFRGFTQAWIFRGDSLRKAGFRF